MVEIESSDDEESRTWQSASRVLIVTALEITEQHGLLLLVVLFFSRGTKYES